MANGSGAPAATPNPFGQQSTPMGGGSSPLDTGGGMSGGQQQPMQTAAFGSGQGQMPNFSVSTPDNVARPGGWLGGGSGGQFQPDPATVSSEYPPQQLDQRAISADPRGFQNYMQQMQQREQQRPGSTMMGSPPPRQNPFQPQQPSFLQDPEYQGYQTQANDLQRQMNEYMQKAPMYQQMQDLQNKMAPFQQRYYQQQQDMQRMQQPLNQQRYEPIQAERAYYERMASQRQQPMQQRQFNPYQQQQQYRQPAGIQGLMGMLSGKNRMQQAQPRMSMDMPQARPAVMPRSFGREQRYAMPSRDYSSIGSVGAARPADPAVAAEAPVVNPSTDYFLNTW